MTGPNIIQPLSDAEWDQLKELFPKSPDKTSRGRPAADMREVVNAILYVLSGQKWETIPQTNDRSSLEGRVFASKSATNRYYRKWKKSGFLNQILKTMKNNSSTPFEIHFPPQRNKPAKVVRLDTNPLSDKHLKS